jgi:CMP-N-acetylneuraminic acid synthetase
MKHKKKSICFIPIKKHSSRIKKKNFKKIGDLPLYQILLNKMLKMRNDFDEIIVDTDSKEIIKFCKKKKIDFLIRPKKFTHTLITGNDLMKRWLKIKPSFYYYFHIHVTSPFVKIQTIKKALNILKKNNNSVFTVNAEKEKYWYKGKPINHNDKLLTRSQDLSPVYKDTTCLYGITKKEFKKNFSRIGKKPIMIETDKIESLDINEMDDLKFARLIYSLNKSVIN